MMQIRGLAHYDPPLMKLWDPGTAGLLRLPSGRLVRGRGLRKALPAGQLPTFGLYLLGKPPPDFGWDSRFVSTWAAQASG